MQIAKRFPYLALAGCSALYFVPFLRVLSHNGDEGTLITGAARVVEGQVPFRDFFEVMGPGTFYWLALFFKVLGTSWFATRVCLLVTTVLLTVVLYYLTRRLSCGRDSIPVILFVAVSFHSWNAISHHMDSNLFGLASLAAFLWWMDKRRPWMLFLAGTGAGLTTWFMLPKGVLLCLSFIALLWIQDRKEVSLWPSVRTLVSGYLLVIGAVVVLFWRAGGLTDLIYANVIWPLTNYGATNAVPYGMEFRQLYWDSFTASIGPLCPPAVTAVICGMLSLPFFAAMGLPLVLVGFVVGYRRRAFDAASLPYWLAGAAFWVSEMHRKDVAHIVYGSPVLIILAFYFCRRLAGNRVNQLVQLTATCAFVLAMLNPLVAVAAQHRLPTRRGTVYNAFEANAVLDFLNAHIRPGEPAFVYPYSPMYYFLSAAENPTRYSILMYGINTGAQFGEVVQSLETKKVHYVVWDRSFPRWINKWFPAYRIPPANELILEPYLAQNYHVVGGSETGYQFLERNDAVSTSIVLPKRLSPEDGGSQ